MFQRQSHWLLSVVVVAVGAIGLGPTSARAQQTTFTPAATQVTPGVLGYRQLIEYDLYSDFEDYTAASAFSYGLTSASTIDLFVPVRYRTSEDRGDDFGLDDLYIGGRYRIYTHNFGPLDTLRVALRSRLYVPTGDDAFSSDSFDPQIGAAMTYIKDRHGLNLATCWRFNSGDDRTGVRRFGSGSDDAGQIFGSYAYRIQPAAFTAETSGGAWYVTAETETRYETNGDAELLLGGGLLYEGADIAFELGVRGPVWADVDNRSELELSVAAGVRLLF